LGGGGRDGKWKLEMARSKDRGAEFHLAEMAGPEAG
jgi:hypothetical protein